MIIYKTTIFVHCLLTSFLINSSTILIYQCVWKISIICGVKSTSWTPDTERFFISNYSFRRCSMYEPNFIIMFKIFNLKIIFVKIIPCSTIIKSNTKLCFFFKRCMLYFTNITTEGNFFVPCSTLPCFPFNLYTFRKMWASNILFSKI